MCFVIATKSQTRPKCRILCSRNEDHFIIDLWPPVGKHILITFFLGVEIQAIIFDFDGVLTDDRVYVDQDGREMVCCNRRDGLGFSILRSLPIKVFILSTEQNPVVSRRGEKLQVPVIQGSKNKAESLIALAIAHNLDLATILFVGNDLNDLPAIQLCGFSACPADGHPMVQKAVNYVLKTKGGDGVTREILETFLSRFNDGRW